MAQGGHSGRQAEREEEEEEIVGIKKNEISL